jgi:phage terminase small subunit
MAKVPEWLPADALAIWRRLAPMHPQAVEHPAQSIHFAQYCFLTADVLRLQIATSGNETIIDRFGQPKVNPLCDEMHRKMGKMLEFARVFGLTPLDEAKLDKVNEGDTEEADIEV